MLERLKAYLKDKKHKKEMHKQFLNIQKWQREMIKAKIDQEIGTNH